MFLESKDHRALASYALILNSMDANKSFVGQFVPFVLAVLKQQQDPKVEAFQIANLIREQFGFQVPKLAMLSIIDYARKQGLLKKGADQFLYPTQEAIENNHIIETSQTVQQKQELVIRDFINFVQKNYHVQLDEDVANEQFSLFFQRNSLPFLLSSHASSLETIFKTQPEEQLYFFYRYITYLDHNSNVDFIKHITDIAFGYILTSLILSEGEDESLTPQLKGMQIFLDTPIIIKLLGLEGVERQEAQEELIAMLQKEGAVLLLLQHTQQEIMSILQDVCNKITTASPDSLYLGKTLASCMYLGLSKADIESRIASFSDFLKKYEISLIDTTYARSENQQYNIDHAKLTKIIKDVYGSSSSPEVVQSREHAIELDVKSIAEVFARRKGSFPTEFSKSTSFLLTSNTGLVISSRKLILEEDVPQKRFIPACLTDSFVTTLLWSKAPTKITQLNKKKMIADCYAALLPDENTLKKFLLRVETLKSEQKITPKMYTLRMYKVTQELLYTKSYNTSVDDMPDATIIEILHGVKQQAEKDANAAYQIKENTLKQKLRDTEQELKRVAQEKEQGSLLYETTQKENQQKLSKRTQYIKNIASKISYVVATLAFLFGILLILIALLFEKFRLWLDVLLYITGGSLLVLTRIVKRKTYAKCYKYLENWFLC